MSLADIERQRAAEERAAARFIAKHGVGNLPGERSETGESSGRQSVGRSGWTQDDMPRKHRDDISYDAYEGGVEQFETDNPGARFLVGGALDDGDPIVQMLLASRVHHTLSFLEDGQRELLFERYVYDGGSTLQELADQAGVSKQAVAKRVGRAEAAFKQAWDDHASDEQSWE